MGGFNKKILIPALTKILKGEGWHSGASFTRDIPKSESYPFDILKWQMFQTMNKIYWYIFLLRSQQTAIHKCFLFCTILKKLPICYHFLTFCVQMEKFNTCRLPYKVINFCTVNSSHPKIILCLAKRRELVNLIVMLLKWAKQLWEHLYYCLGWVDPSSTYTGLPNCGLVNLQRLSIAEPHLCAECQVPCNY